VIFATQSLRKTFAPMKRSTLSATKFAFHSDVMTVEAVGGESPGAASSMVACVDVSKASPSVPAATYWHQPKSFHRLLLHRKSESECQQSSHH
jgi:hypothetical protein